MSHVGASPPVRILLIEDEPDIREPLMSFLSSEGFEVEGAQNGRVALDRLAKGLIPDLILLDMKMPVMNGWEFAREYRRLTPTPAPLIVMTAAADAEERGREVGAAGWLGKPLSLDELLEKLSVASVALNGSKGLSS